MKEIIYTEFVDIRAQLLPTSEHCFPFLLNSKNQGKEFHNITIKQVLNLTSFRLQFIWVSFIVDNFTLVFTVYREQYIFLQTQVLVSVY